MYISKEGIDALMQCCSFPVDPLIYFPGSIHLVYFILLFL